MLCINTYKWLIFIILVFILFIFQLFIQASCHYWHAYCSLKHHVLERNKFFVITVLNVIGKILGQYFKLLLYVFLPNVRNPDLEHRNIKISCKIFNFTLFKFLIKFEKAYGRADTQNFHLVRSFRKSDASWTSA